MNVFAKDVRRCNNAYSLTHLSINIQGAQKVLLKKSEEIRIMKNGEHVFNQFKRDFF